MIDLPVLSYTVTVKVSGEAGQPLAGVDFIWGAYTPPWNVPASRETDQDGVAVFPIRYAGEYVIIASLSGYYSLPARITVSGDMEVSIRMSRTPVFGWLQCSARKDGVEVGALVLGVGPVQRYTPFNVQIAPGTYRLRAIYGGAEQEKDATVSSDAVTRVDFDFTTAPPLPPLPPFPPPLPAPPVEASSSGALVLAGGLALLLVLGGVAIYQQWFPY